jgi:hypothetical protein
MNFSSRNRDGPIALLGKLMPEPRRKYVEVVPWTRAAVARALAADDPALLLQAVIAVSMSDDDQHYAESLCVKLAGHAHFNVRGNAVLGFGHIARVHRKLNKQVVFPLIVAALTDSHEYVRGHADSARDDTAHFLRWKYDNV